MNYGFTPDPGERILRIIHRHPVTLAGPLATSVIMVILAMAFTYLAARYPAAVPYAGTIALALAAVLGLMAVAILLISVYVYRRTVLIFTSVHLIQSEQYGLFAHRIAQVDFRRVQDVSGSKIGFFQTIFNFGNVEVQSAGEQEKFIFRNAPDPQVLADEALETRDRCMHEAQAGDGLGNAGAAKRGLSQQPGDIEE